jgi:hypothetical protein
LILGTLIDFVPGAEEDWFWLCVPFLLFGFLTRSRIQMIAAFLLMVFATIAAIQGHKHGAQYRAWLKEKHPDSYLKMYGHQ